MIHRGRILAGSSSLPPPTVTGSTTVATSAAVAGDHWRTRLDGTRREVTAVNSSGWADVVDVD